MRKPKIVNLLIVRPTAAEGKALYALAMELEAWKLSFTHPLTGKRMEFENSTPFKK